MKLDDDFDSFVDATYLPPYRLARGSEQWLDLRDAFFAGVVSAASATGADLRQAIAVHNVRCPNCQARPAAAESSGAAAPKVGDYTACLRCGAILCFVAGAGGHAPIGGHAPAGALGLAAVTDEELTAAYRAEPRLYFGLMLLRRLMERAQARRRAAMN